MGDKKVHLHLQVSFRACITCSLKQHLLLVNALYISTKALFWSIGKLNHTLCSCQAPSILSVSVKNVAVAARGH